MSKLTLVFLAATLAVAVKGYPSLDNTLASAAAAGNWDQVHKLLGNFYRQSNNWAQPQQPQPNPQAQLHQLQQQTQNAVQEVQQRVQQQLAQQAAQYAQQPAIGAQQPALYSQQSAGHLANAVGGNSGVGGGRVYEESQSTYTDGNGISGGHKIINDNGKVSEFDLTPQAVRG